MTLSCLGDRAALDSLSEALGHMVERNPKRAPLLKSIVSSEAIWLAPLQVAICSTLLGMSETSDDTRAGWFNTLATMLSALGRREEALEVAKKAVARYRTLAGAPLDVFTPDLARSLGALGMVYKGMEKDLDAADQFEEGARRLAPLFPRLPQAHATLMHGLAREYLAMAEKLSRPIDEA
ncbi:MAG: tetratricopeptide repeat protein [Rhodospirillum sp.]|nr:tetratricopeptide repeat protein [Rhodospirillum sp.]MCF8487689.1 tetratricopeptide repeat protein [Rhodospirillum sp.]MCF8499585.1 tetratricopeptide repeat protein [Rhodospirillum sp.]